MNEAPKQSAFKLTAVPGKWTGARLSGLPSGGTLSVQLTTTGHVAICLLDIDGYESLPEIRSPILTAETDNDYAFSIVIPEAGDYFLVADNRGGTETRQIDVSVTVSSPSQVLDRADVINIATTLLRVVEKAMHLVFRLEPLDVAAATKDVEDSAESGRIKLSHDFSEAVFQTVRDREMSSNILLFTVFQQIAVQLIRRNDDAPQMSIDAVDELAVALSKMFGYTDHMRRQAEYLAQNHVAQSVEMILGTSQQGILSMERAQRAMTWVDDPDLLRHWSSVLLHDMQTVVLDRFRNEPPAWTTTAEVTRVLSSRDPVG